MGYRKKRERYEGFLKKVELLKALEDYEISKIADSVKPINFQANTTIVKEVLLI